MIVNKHELIMMMKNFWSLKNNDLCEKSTIIFLKRWGKFSNEEIKFILDTKELLNINDEDETYHHETLVDTMEFWANTFDGGNTNE